MLKLIIGLKGTGKTKTLIQMINTSLETTKGSVVCIEKGKKLVSEVKYQCRLIAADEYIISDAQSLYGFVAGILANNHDITDLYIDNAMQICGFDEAAFDKFVDEVAKLSEQLSFNCVVSATLDAEKASETVKKYI